MKRRNLDKFHTLRAALEKIIDLEETPFGSLRLAQAIAARALAEMKQGKFDLSRDYRQTQRNHDSALAGPQNFYLTGDGKAAEWEQVFSKGLPAERARVRIMEARYLDWLAQRRCK